MVLKHYKSSYRSTSVPAGAYEPFEFSHVRKANLALDDLNSLTMASRKHDKNFIDDLNAKFIMDSTLGGLPPRSTSRKAYHVATPSSATNHVSRRTLLLDGVGLNSEGENLLNVYTPITSSYARGYSLPPSAYNELLYQNGVRVSSSDPSYGHTKRMSLAADSAVRQAHRDVNRVERELGLSHFDEPSAIRRYRSFSYSMPPRSSSSVTYEHRPTVRHYSPGPAPATHVYRHRFSEAPRHHYEVHDSAPSYTPLYSPVKLVRCLTETPVTKISGRSVDEFYAGGISKSRSTLPSYYVPQLQVSLPTPIAPAMSTTSRHLHTTKHYRAPLYNRSSSVTALNRLPDSVGHWYHGPSKYYLGSSYDLSPSLVPSYQQPMRSHVYMTSSSSSGPSEISVAGPSPPYHTRVIGDDASFVSYNDSSLRNYHHYVPDMSSSSSWTLPSVPVYHPQQHHVVSKVHHTSHVHYPSAVVHATKTAASLSPSLDKPLESHMEVSEARKKVRQVLCKVKKDPTYFD